MGFKSLFDSWAWLRRRRSLSALPSGKSARALSLDDICIAISLFTCVVSMNSVRGRIDLARFSKSLYAYIGSSFKIFLVLSDSPLMNGCPIYWVGPHRFHGSISKIPLRKSRKHLRLSFSSSSYVPVVEDLIGTDSTISSRLLKEKYFFEGASFLWLSRSYSSRVLKRHPFFTWPS